MILLDQRWPGSWARIIGKPERNKMVPSTVPWHEVGPGTQPRTRIGACRGGAGGGGGRQDPRNTEEEDLEKRREPERQGGG